MSCHVIASCAVHVSQPRWLAAVVINAVPTRPPATTHNATMPERAFFKLLVKEGHEQEYIDRHKAVWPEVQADLQGA
jgi:hypothetical protein